MNAKIKNGIALSLIPQIILVKWLANYPEFIETYYSKGLYKVVSDFSRTLLGWIPFSVGDIGYTMLGFLAIRYLIIKRRDILKHPIPFFRNIVFVLAIAYFMFHVLWGFNYYRQPLSNALGLKSETSQEELLEFVEQLIVKTNAIHLQISKDSAEMVKIPFLAYNRPSIKKSLYSIPLTYMGYGGYLNPFTNEAQVNSKLPNFRFPVVAGHEIGHQLGYSAENETNFIGYIATANNDNLYFKYAAYTYALSYCLGDIRQQDPALFEKLYGKLNSGIKKNFQEMATFWEAYENPMEPYFKAVFNSFLKANNQPQGIQSYNLVVTLLVAYHQKYPL
jgi:hypothetical protein